MKILLIDNYDSFTYNLAQYLGEVDEDPEVVRNDEITVEEIKDKVPDAIVISPGPGTPSDAGISLDIITDLGSDIPILGVCLGHQCIAEAHGGSLKRADRLLHGKTSRIFHQNPVLYQGLPNPVKATRYHSLLVKKNTLSEELVIDSISEEKEIMGLHHVEKPLIGVQFHPESILTEHGRDMISNFLEFVSDPKPIGTGETPTVPEQSDSSLLSEDDSS
jgi:anthranilate synthase/aminodeoxychorismate synthase-like glutamine amidotransferase